MGYKSKAYCVELKRKGKLVFTDDNKIDFEKSRARISGTADISRDSKVEPKPIPCQPAPAPTDMDFNLKNQYDRARVYKLSMDARRQKLAHEREVGNLGSIQQIKNVGFEIGRALRNRLTTFTRRAAPIVSMESDTKKNYEYLAKEIENIIAEIQGDIDAVRI